MSDSRPLSTQLDMGYQDSLNENEMDQKEVNFPYRSALGSLMYAMIGTWPDILVAVSIASKYSNDPRKEHVNIIKRVFSYLNGSKNCVFAGLC